MQYSCLLKQLHLDVPYLRGGMDLGQGEVLTLDRFVNTICVNIVNVLNRTVQLMKNKSKNKSFAFLFMPLLSPFPCSFLL